MNYTIYTIAPLHRSIGNYSVFARNNCYFNLKKNGTKRSVLLGSIDWKPFTLSERGKLPIEQESWTFNPKHKEHSTVCYCITVIMICYTNKRPISNVCVRGWWWANEIKKIVYELLMASIPFLGQFICVKCINNKNAHSRDIEKLMHICVHIDGSEQKKTLTTMWCSIKFHMKIV